MTGMTVAICTYNGAAQLPGLIAALRRQTCPVPFEILIVDNNSTDNTAEVVARLADQPGAPLRRVVETEQGIPFARNRAIEESLGKPYMAFIDADELPGERWLNAALTALVDDNAECVGGRIQVQFPANDRPAWLSDELLGFLGEVDNGPQPLWITDYSTPVWSGNVAYRTAVFSTGLRFDSRYNRRGKGIGGGSDAVMFRHLVDQQARIRYHPDMKIEHHVDTWKLQRSYFLRLHYLNGRRHGQFVEAPPGRRLFGIPPYLFMQALHQWGRTLPLFLRNKHNYIRQAMNATHATGVIVGCYRRSQSGET